jgi:hypothetical protein
MHERAREVGGRSKNAYRAGNVLELVPRRAHKALTCKGNTLNSRSQKAIWRVFCIVFTIATYTRAGQSAGGWMFHRRHDRIRWFVHARSLSGAHQISNCRLCAPLQPTLQPTSLLVSSCSNERCTESGTHLLLTPFVLGVQTAFWN